MIKHVNSPMTETKVSPVDDAMVQPNAVDLRVAKVYSFSGGTFTLAEDIKEHRMQSEVNAYRGFYELKAGYYVVEFDQRVKVGKSEAGYVVGRSTLMRNGVIIHSCLYDSGYEGKMIAGMTVTGGTFLFAPHTRLAQFIVTDAMTAHLYNGSYQEGDRN